MKKSLRKLGKEGNFLKLIKDIYQKNPFTNIILNDERPNYLFLRFWIRQDVHSLHAYLVSTWGQEKKKKSTYTHRKEKLKLSLFSDNVMVFLRKSRRIHNKAPGASNWVEQVLIVQCHRTKSLFLYTINNNYNKNTFYVPPNKGNT